MGNKQALGSSSTVDDVAADANVDLTGKYAIVTGANSGIGLVTARALVQLGVHVTIGCRDQAKIDAAIATITAQVGTRRGSISGIPLELSSMRSIKAFAKTYRAKNIPLHMLILNAGIMEAPKGYTEDGFEMQFGVNHLAHFLLTNLLLDIVKKSAPSRIVALSSALQGPIQWDDLNAEKSYSPRGRYGMSKLATILFVKELQRRLDEDGADVVAHSLHPGVIRTNLQQHFPLFFKALFSLMRPFLKTPEQGAATTIYAAIHPQTKAHGLYYEDCAIAKPNKHALNDEDAKRLWGISEDMVDLKQALIELQGDSKLNEKKKNKKSNKSSKNTQISSSTSSGSE